MRFVDAFLSFPSIFLLLALAAFIKPSPFMITVATMRRAGPLADAGRVTGSSGAFITGSPVTVWSNAIGPTAGAEGSNPTTGRRGRMA